MISIDLVVPTFKETLNPIEEVFQMQIHDAIETDYSYIYSEPLIVYSRQILYDDDVPNTVYGTDNEFNTLFYDLEQNLDSEASEEQVPDCCVVAMSFEICQSQLLKCTNLNQPRLSSIPCGVYWISSSLPMLF